ncbi:aminotransferase class III-fold pyridoxal phosphate-dependent enzyme [Eubacterium barkeri]|uniref:Aminotransferase class-III n=1 Tax=Eubacterium barkeri TaxID=1528 RepID=A0A1H3BPP9_EUBBA|nr:aminotransferase class III-fold pyridoxal phosphate-dependent enzyme [Eubacterium barkeri]SDX43942.1 Aminotransferase class-III [Eubacterium barkeri]
MGKENHIAQQLSHLFNDQFTITSPHMQYLRDSNSREYIGYYSDCLLWDFGYLNSTINHRINAAVMTQRASDSPINIDVLIAEIQGLLIPHLPKGFKSLYFNQTDFGDILSQTFLTTKKTNFLTLESTGLPLHLSGERITAINDCHNLEDFGDLERFLKDQKKNTAAFLIDPYIKEKGRLATPEEMASLLQFITQSGIPLIWIESSIGLGRTGQLFTAAYYNVKPDLLVYSGDLLGDRQIHLLATTRKYKKAIAAQAPTLRPGDAGSLLMFNVLLESLIQDDMLGRIQSLGHRFLGKVRALDANTTETFLFRGVGLCLFLDFQKPGRAKDFQNFMAARGILVHLSPWRPSVVCLFPPFILEDADVDTFIEGMMQFFLK